MFTLPTTVVIAGREVPVRTDFRVVLEIFVMLADPALSDTDKTEALLRMFYEERPADIPAAVQAFRVFVDQKTGPAGKAPTARPSLINWSRDFPLMVGPINHVLGGECRSMPYLHWYTVLAAYMEIPPDSVFSQTLRIREKLRAGKKLEKWEKDFYRRNPDLVSPPTVLSPAEKEMLSAWTKKSTESPAKRVFVEEDEQRNGRAFLTPQGSE
jgi:hypothetical protein